RLTQVPSVSIVPPLGRFKALRRFKVQGLAQGELPCFLILQTSKGSRWWRGGGIRVGARQQRRRETLNCPAGSAIWRARGRRGPRTPPHMRRQDRSLPQCRFAIGAALRAEPSVKLRPETRLP